MHRWIEILVLPAFALGAAVLGLAATEEPTILPEFRVDGTPWLYAKTGDIEILTRASPARTKQMAAALLRGTRLYPEFFTMDRSLRLLLIVADSPRGKAGGLAPAVLAEADGQHWPKDVRVVRENYHVLADDRDVVVAINLADVDNVWLVLTTWANRLVRAQRPEFAEWVTTGLFGAAGPFNSVMGRPQSITVRLPRLSWSDPAMESGTFPPEAGDLPDFATMFDPTRKSEELPQAERWKFEFQTAFFARWSLFGPAKNGRNRSGYWAFAEMARRGQATEAIFRECYGMDWPQARAEMRAYLKPKSVGMIDVQMPQVMADVPEAEWMEFRDGTLEEVHRILGDFNRLRSAEEAERNEAKERNATKPTS